MRRLGLDVDFVRPGADLAGYKLVLVPTMPHVSDAAERAFARADGLVLYGPRTGSKTRHHAIPPNLPPGPLSALVKARVLEISSLRPGLAHAVEGEIGGAAIRWRESLDVQGADILARFKDGAAALIAAGNHHYLACWPDTQLLASLMGLMVAKADLPAVELPQGIRLRRRGNMLFAFNYGTRPWRLPEGGKLLIGTRELKPQDVAIIA